MLVRPQISWFSQFGKEIANLGLASGNRQCSYGLRDPRSAVWAGKSLILGSLQETDGVVTASEILALQFGQGNRLS